MSFLFSHVFPSSFSDVPFIDKRTSPSPKRFIKGSESVTQESSCDTYPFTDATTFIDEPMPPPLKRFKMDSESVTQDSFESGFFTAFSNALKNYDLIGNEYFVDLKSLLDRFYLKLFPFESMDSLREIGSGGFSTVYECNFSSTLSADSCFYTNKVTYAAKKFSRTKSSFDYCVTNSSLDYFDDAANELACLCKAKSKKIDYVVPVYGISLDKESQDIYIVMKLCQGSLQSLFNQNQRLQDKQKCKCILDIVNGVKALHDNKIIHCDLKPDNILYDYDDDGYHFYISDFNYSKPFGTYSLIMGTLQYIAPECIASYTNEIQCIWKQIRDIYSLALIIYVVFSGKTKPYDNEDDLEEKIKDGLRPSVEDDIVCQDLRILLLEMLDAIPKKRPKIHAVLRGLLSLDSFSSLKYYASIS